MLLIACLAADSTCKAKHVLKQHLATAEKPAAFAMLVAQPFVHMFFQFYTFPYTAVGNRHNCLLCGRRTDSPMPGGCNCSEVHMCT